MMFLWSLVFACIWTLDNAEKWTIPLSTFNVGYNSSNDCSSGACWEGRHHRVIQALQFEISEIVVLQGISIAQLASIQGNIPEYICHSKSTRYVHVLPICYVAYQWSCLQHSSPHQMKRDHLNWMRLVSLKNSYKHVCVFNIDWENFSRDLARRELAVSELKDEIKKNCQPNDDIIVMGSANVEPHDEAIQLISKKEHYDFQLEDVMEHENKGTFMGDYYNETSTLRNDYIWVKKSMNHTVKSEIIRNRSYNGLFPSKHALLRVTLMMEKKPEHDYTDVQSDAYQVMKINCQDSLTPENIEDGLGVYIEWECQGDGCYKTNCRYCYLPTATNYSKPFLSCPQHAVEEAAMHSQLDADEQSKKVIKEGVFKPNQKAPAWIWGFMAGMILLSFLVGFFLLRKKNKDNISK